MRTIIAPTDFSPVSLNAVDYAADMACMLSARLTLFHVYSIPIPVGEVPMPPYSTELIEEEVQQEMEKLKEKLLVRTGGKTIIHNEIEMGSVLSKLTTYCATIKPFAVVMGAGTANGIERFLFGGKTTGALEQVQWPLLIVPPLVKFKNIRKIGLACDFREVIESVRVKEIQKWVEEFQAELHVLHVSDKTKEALSSETIAESGLLQEMLGEMHPKYHFINKPAVEQGIAEFAEVNKLDLLIIIPKKHGLISKIFQYSHSKRLVLHTHVPVVAIHE
ncbi:Nucleotide-binding universal stress protein, UspA family [Hydrobacter penzbergensis]|uniref:Nucleotide-binding universal stress protein, UspA family n=1 Tax=Hydrobacter penzbergensis TaxID=1235997 RepID=A0A8X8ICI7_9BACT|nr:universal stress protein [Hydrobacter penzbergensis]SDW92818.1 Nucleotide-binding universal stress protein, UspA family [Hydrobacter penzbergensis]HEX2924785.1 universal stress protein [Ruminiclostridium sp.]